MLLLKTEFYMNPDEMCLLGGILFPTALDKFNFSFYLDNMIALFNEFQQLSI